MVNAPQTLSLLEDFEDIFSNKEKMLELARMTLIGLQYSAETHRTEDNPSREELSQALGMAHTLTDNMTKFDAYFCSDDISPVIEHAAKVMDSTDKIDASIFPSDFGFCYFENGINVSELMLTHVLVWAKVNGPIIGKDAWVVMGFNDMANQEDGVAARRKEIWEERRPGTPYESPYGRWLFHGSSIVLDGALLFDKETPNSEKIQQNIFEGKLHISDINRHSLLHSLFLMIRQEKIVDSSQRETHVNKKRITRLKSKGLPTEVVVVRLRKTRYVNSQEGSGSFEYSMRWFVSGHWRWQPYKTEDGIEDYKRIFISPYIKGPEDKPLKISKRVIAIVK